MAVLNDRRKKSRGHSRRHALRWLVTRNVQIHVGRPNDKEPLILMGYTYDMSATGLSVHLPALDCNVQEFFEEHLEVVISTTPKLVKVKVTPVHCETVVPGIPDKSASIGVRVNQEDAGYRSYVEYLREFQ